MKAIKHLIQLISVFLISMSILEKPSYGQQLDWSVINSGNSTLVTGAFNGANMGGYSYGLINEQGPTISVTDECIQCLDYSCNALLNPDVITAPEIISMQTKTSVLQETVKLRPQVLRFPGGTQSGWYHLYDYGESTVYDASAPLMAKCFGMLIGEAVFLANPKSLCQSDSRLTSTENYISGFTNYINNIKDSTGGAHQVQVTYVVNLLTHFNFDPVSIFCLQTCGRTPALTPMSNYDCSQQFTYSYAGNEALFNNDPDVYRFELYYKETQDAIQFLVDSLDLNATDPLYVEMGNEYYDNDGGNPGYNVNNYGMSVNEYADLAEIYAERLKCYFTGKVDLKVGLVSKSSRTWHNTSNTSSPNYPGLVNLMSQDFTADGATLNDVVDAVILHDYYNANNCLSEDDINLRFECGKEHLNAHIEQGGDVSQELDDFKNDFPGKKIWVTEWNLVGGTDSKNLNFINTPLHAAFVQEYAMSFLEYNANNGNLIEMTAHHRIGYDNKWSIIQTEDGDNSVANVRAAAHPIRFLNELYVYDNFHFIGNILSDGTTEYDTKEAKATAVYQIQDNGHPQDRILIYYTNKTADKIALNIPQYINNLSVNSAVLSCISGDQLFTYGPSNSTFGKNSFNNSTQTYENQDLDGLGYGLINNQLQEEVNLPLTVGGSDSLDANSVGLIVVNLEPIGTGLNEALNPQIKVYPNPANERLFVVGYSGEYSLIDLSGRVVASGTIESGNSIELSDFVAGVYVLKIEKEQIKIVVR